MAVKNTLYYQVMVELKQKIQSGEFPTNSKLPTEQELQKLFKVSRVTLRRAINQLVQEGLIEKIQGNGSYVRKPHKVKKLLRFNTSDSFSLTAKRNGFVPTAKIVNFANMVPPKEIRESFDLKEEDCLNVKRVLYIDGQPSIIDDSYIPAPFYQGIAEETVKDSLYETLKSKTGAKKLIAGITLVGALQADSVLAQLLEKPLGSALLTITNELVTENNVSVQYSREYADPEVYQIRIH